MREAVIPLYNDQLIGGNDEFMSTLIWGKITVNNWDAYINDKTFNFDIVKTCAENNVGIDFKSRTGIPNVKFDISNILFTISDNFLVSNCDRFMEPIYYPPNKNPSFDKLRNDIGKLKNILNELLKYEYVSCVEIYISFGEAELEDYDYYTIQPEDFEKTVFSSYINEKWIPTICLCTKSTII